MSWLKYVGGALAGVGAVVALPVAGPIGAVTAIGAVVGASIGAAGAAVISEDESEARGALASERAENVMTQEQLSEVDKYFNQALSYFAVGVCAANADGHICDDEMDAINAFTKGLDEQLHGALPDKYKQRFDEIIAAPPSLNTAITMVEEAWDTPDWDSVEDLIRTVISADGDHAEEEYALLEAFKRQIAA